jgi:hypothetical protein
MTGRVEAPPHARRWDTPGLPPRDDRDRCPHHYGLCAYRADDPARCPTCHATWSVIARTGWHSCPNPAPEPGASGQASRALAAPSPGPGSSPTPGRQTPPTR